MTDGGTDASTRASRKKSTEHPKTSDWFGVVREVALPGHSVLVLTHAAHSSGVKAEQDTSKSTWYRANQHAVKGTLPSIVGADGAGALEWNPNCFLGRFVEEVTLPVQRSQRPVSNRPLHLSCFFRQPGRKMRLGQRARSSRLLGLCSTRHDLNIHFPPTEGVSD